MTRRQARRFACWLGAQWIRAVREGGPTIRVEGVEVGGADLERVLAALDSLEGELERRGWADGTERVTGITEEEV